MRHRPPQYVALPSYTVEVTGPGTLELGEVRATDPTGDETVVFFSEPSEPSPEQAEDVQEPVDVMDSPRYTGLVQMRQEYQPAVQ